MPAFRSSYGACCVICPSYTDIKMLLFQTIMLVSFYMAIRCLDVDYGFIIGNTITTSWVVTCSESDTVIGSYLDDLEGDAAIEAADAKKLALSLSLSPWMHMHLLMAQLL